MRLPSSTFIAATYALSSVIIGPIIVLTGGAFVGNGGFDESICGTDAIKVENLGKALMFQRFSTGLMLVLGTAILVWLVRNIIKRTGGTGQVEERIVMGILVLGMMAGYTLIIWAPMLPCAIQLGLQQGP